MIETGCTNPWQPPYWYGMEVDISAFVKACSTYQRFEEQTKIIGRIPLKTVTMIAWEYVYQNLVGPCTLIDTSGTDRVNTAMIIAGQLVCLKLVKYQKNPV